MASRDVVHLRGNRRSSNSLKASSIYQGVATKTGEVIPRLNSEVDTTTPAPINLVLGSGTLYGNIYISATWEAVADTTVVAYQVTFARAGVTTTQRVDSNSAWFEPAVGGETYTVSVVNVHVNGVLSANTVSDTVVAATDSTVPAVPGGLSVGAGFKSITVSWSENTEPDMEFGLGQYRVQLSDDVGFSNIVKDKVVGALVTSFTDLSTSQTYYARVAAIDTSGNQSAFSSGLGDTTGQIQTTDYAALSITNATIANATIETGKMVSLDVNKLSAGTGFITALTIASGGSIESDNYDGVGPVYGGWKINDSLAEFNNVTIRGTLDGATGDFAGDLIAGTIHIPDLSTTANSFHVNGNGRMWIGATTYADAPFRVNQDGVARAQKLTITGTSAVDADLVVGALSAATISATDITAGLITGSTLSTGTGQHVEINSNEIDFFSATSTKQGTISGDGANGLLVDGASGSAGKVKLLGDLLELEAGSGPLTLAITGGDIDADVVNGSILLNAANTTTETVDLMHDEVMCVRAAWSVVFSDDVAVLRRRSNTGGTGLADVGLGVVGTYSSRGVLKQWTNSIDRTEAVARVQALRPVDYAYTSAASGELGALRTHRGFVVEEVAAVDPVLVNYGWIDKNDVTQSAQPPSDAILEAAGFKGDWNGWAAAEYPLEDAVPTMWDEHAIITDVVAATQDLLDRVAKLEAP
jgi:hypothetical protein